MSVSMKVCATEVYLQITDTHIIRSTLMVVQVKELTYPSPFGRMAA